MHIQASVLSPAVLAISLLALPLGTAYAQGKGAVTLNCSYAESNHVQRTPMAGGNQEWQQARDVVYHICPGCTVDNEALGAAGGGSQPALWNVTDSEYSYDYSNGSMHSNLKINRYSGSATLILANSGMPEFYEGGIAIFTSTGKCQKMDKPNL